LGAITSGAPPQISTKDNSVFRKKRFFISGILIFIALGYLIFAGLQGSATYYYTVGEFMELKNSLYGENIRLNGIVVPGSVEQETAKMNLHFLITDGEAQLPVVYHGVVPDTFKVGNETVVEGQLNAAGVFEADLLMPKCPSKYVPIQ